MSLQFARIYNNLIRQYSNIKTVIDTRINLYLDSFDSFEFVNSDEDYDKFCENNKKNEIVRNTSKFITCLVKENVVDKIVVINILNKLEKKVNSLILIENVKEHLEEIFENMKIIILNSYTVYKYDLQWINLINNVKLISTFNSSDFKSLSNKMIFKCSDIIEELEDLGMEFDSDSD